MNESSQTSSKAGPRAPRRDRGHARVEVLLSAAAQVFADKGYEAATTTEIAAAAQSSIGSLYQFFPTKQAVALALIRQQSADLGARLAAMAEASAGWDVDEVARRLAGALVDFRASHPSFARLIDTPGAPEAVVLDVRRGMRLQLAAILAPHAPALGRARLMAVAAVVQQVMKSAVALNDDPAADNPSAARAALAELREMLRVYLGAALA
ncbi:TetR/AcrR family transcriptional regulator [Roseateles saccharophilus]|uniref:TetR family transcriptional regulator n=1 Tax=Roseateles saccharophilus TaxID=304 RepID=A0A4R3VBM6_ROSSA|nr:TetR family transcriptional regulator [Roseateles saccharophilus]MDG0831785.1 TetR/AcrR family transcriptional regulator [Roseateles saccharophilus]TCV01193.1 TetR family transcriptional regulator [Roseateles saccharophilus]